MKRRVCLAMAFILLAASGCAPMGAVRNPAPPFTVDIMSTGKSDCILITLDGLVLLNDAAEEDDADSIRALLEKRNIKRIDYLILSHYDKDHIGSAAALIRQYEIGRIIGPDYPENSTFAIALSDAAFAKGIVREKLTETLTIETAGGSFTIDPPDRDYGDDNNNSLIVSVRYRDTSVLLMGDAKKKRIREQLAVTEEHYDLIKLPHHGNSSDVLEELIGRTEPRWAAATVDDRADVEEPLCAALRSVGCELLCTCDGDLSFVWREGDGLIRTNEA